MWTWIIIIFAAAFVLAIVFRKKLPFIKDLAEPSSPKSDPSSFASTVFLKAHFRGTTPKGVQVYSYMADVSASCRQLIDRGMQHTFNIAEEDYFYTNGLKHSDYKVSVWPRSSKCEGVGFLMAGYPVGERGYDQTEYDKDPTPGHYEICVAGDFRVFNGVWAISVVDDVAMAEIGARYEIEHAVLFANDMDKFNATADHSQGGGHPILVGEQDRLARGFYAGAAFKCSGGQAKSVS